MTQPDRDPTPPVRHQGGSSGDGFLAFAGYPLLLMGIVLLASSWRYVSFNLEGPSDELVKFLAGWISLGAGILAVSGGEVWYLDARSETFVRSWRVFEFPVHQRSIGFDRIDAVRFSHLPARRGSHQSFRVDLEMANGSLFRVANPVTVAEALELSTKLCRILSKPWGDTTSGKVIRRDWTQVQINLLERSRRSTEGTAARSLERATSDGYELEGPGIQIHIGERSGESTELVFAGGALWASGDIHIPFEQILSVESHDRLVVIGRNSYLECGLGLPAAVLARFRDRIVSIVSESNHPET